MKNLTLIMILSLLLFGCKKDSASQEALSVKKQLIGQWQKLSHTEVFYDSDNKILQERIAPAYDVNYDILDGTDAKVRTYYWTNTAGVIRAPEITYRVISDNGASYLTAEPATGGNRIKIELLSSTNLTTIVTNTTDAYNKPLYYNANGDIADHVTITIFYKRLP